MSTTVLEAVGTYLSTNLAAYTLGTNLWLGTMLDTPDVAMGLYEYDGLAPVELMDGQATTLDRPSLQVICRASREDYPTARDAALAARTLIGAVTNATLSGILIQRIMPTARVMPLGVDDQDRPRVAASFDCTVTP